MKRRELLRLLGSTLAAGGALLPGLAARGVARIREATPRSLRRSLRAPSDLLLRIRRRTQPLDERSLEDDNELAG